MRKDGVNVSAVGDAVSVLNSIENVSVECNVSMAELTRFRAGGRADILVQPHTVESAMELIRVCLLYTSRCV